MGALIVNGNFPELVKIYNEANLFLRKETDDIPSKSSVLKIWFASIAIKGISKGDPSAFNILLDRIIGKVKEEQNINHSGIPEGQGTNQKLIVTFVDPERKQIETIEEKN